jgi:hypothetical protein
MTVEKALYHSSDSFFRNTQVFIRVISIIRWSPMPQIYSLQNGEILTI